MKLKYQIAIEVSNWSRSILVLGPSQISNKTAQETSQYWCRDHTWSRRTGADHSSEWPHPRRREPGVFIHHCPACNWLRAASKGINSPGVHAPSAGPVRPCSGEWQGTLWQPSGVEVSAKGMRTGCQCQLLPGRLFASSSPHCHGSQSVVPRCAASVSPGNLLRNAIYLASSQTFWIRNSGGEAQPCGFWQAFQRVLTHAQAWDPPHYCILGQLGPSRFKETYPCSHIQLIQT